MEILKKTILGAWLAIIACAPFFSFAQTYADSDVPLILPRAVWENTPAIAELLDWMPEDKDAASFADENPNSNDAIPDYAPVERIVIHDTGCQLSSSRCNGDAVDPKEIIQSIYRNHALVRGWGDIGYHYIIDRKGNIYEGRYGGNGARGAHVYDSKRCQNFNVGTIGIVLLGNYVKTPPPQAATESLARLVGWLSTTNALDPEDIVKTAPVWTNPKTNGKCDATYGGFTASFTGPVVVGHNTIEPANTDPGLLDLSFVRAQAKTWKDRYATYLYRDQYDKIAVAIEGGVMKKISDDATALPAGETRTVVNMNSTQLALFPSENTVKLSDGTLIKSRARGDIYKIEDGKRRHIASAGIFKKYGFLLSAVKVLSDRELLGYANGDVIAYPEDTLLESQKDGKRYVIKNGEKRYVVSLAVFRQNKFKEKDIVKVSEEEIEALPSGGIVGLPEGTVVSLSSKASAPNYMISDGGKKLISSWAMFNRWKFSKQKIKVISKKDFAQYPDKGELLLPDKSLIRVAGASEVYAVFGGKKYWIMDGKVFADLKLNMSAVNALSTSDMARYAHGGNVLSIADWQAIVTGKKPVKVAAVAVPPTAVPAAPSLGGSMKVALFSSGKNDAISISANGVFTITPTKGDLKTFNTGETAVINWESDGDAAIIAKDSGTLFTVNSYHSYNWDKSLDFNSFRGSLSLVYSQKSKKVWLVNVLPFEEYLQGLGEALNTDAMEYRKAFAVAARSYALYHLSNKGKYGADEVYYLNNTPSDQVYRGYAWEAYAPNLVEATKATAGEVMQYNSKVARTVYSSDSGGTTKNACSLWGGEFCGADYGYLAGGVKDPEGTVRRDAASQKASHGVGMSAAGARRLAELGKTYKEILGYYYKDIAVEKVY